MEDKSPEMDDEARKDFLVDRAKEAIEHQLETEDDPFEDERPQRPELNSKRNSLDEKVEQKASKKTSGEWSMEEIKFLKNNRSEMSNEEMEEFMNRESEFHRVDWEPFSRSQERYLIQAYQTSDLEELAEQMDRSEEVLDLKLRMMGLEVPEAE
ncbi:MAG: hypothetical protein BRC30_01605 [Nanohaloarchaea archaeon SW_7_46_7]|nr:MAG: hypothetical protein BRC30_01605 [Nanohaloarchaea archaeon SW_7_46_7]